jgi:hypothetical protein
VRRTAVASVVAGLALSACVAGGSGQPAASEDVAPDQEAVADAGSPEPDDGTPAAEPDDGGAAPETASPQPDATEEPDTEPPVEALSFTARALGGGTVDLAVHSGDAVALWMWAPW